MVAGGAEVMVVTLYVLDPWQIACCSAVLEGLGSLVHFLLRALCYR